MTHWAANYIGDEWIAGEHDCWAFVRRVYREQYGLDLPAIDIDACNRRACIQALSGAEAERGNWHPSADPVEGDAVLIGKSDRPSHVGVWVDTNPIGAVLHCVQGAGVILQDITTLRLSGWRVLGWYRRVF